MLVPNRKLDSDSDEDRRLMSKIIVMMGPPGAGKGTQARLLAERRGIPQISTGEILREMAKANTPLASKIKSDLEEGRLVSDDVLADIILKRTSQPDCEGGYILDGFPRTIEQARLLENLAASQGHEVRLIKIIVPRELLMQRLTGRRTCSKCGEIYNIFFRPPRVEGVCDFDGAPLIQRADDQAETVLSRLADYERWTQPLIDYYRTSDRLTEIDGTLPVAEVFEALLSAIAAPVAKVV
jgi:adenylate kinase